MSDICTTCPSQKLAHHYLSPFMIVQKVGQNMYWLHLPTSMSCLHPIFNVIKLPPTLSDPIPGWKANLPPLPEIVDGEEHYMVEWILDSQFMRGHLQFLVKWEGTDTRKIHGYWSKMSQPQTNSMSSITYTLVLNVESIRWPSNPSCPVL